MNLEDDTWEVIYSYFRDTPNYLVRHHIESYNDFIQNKIPLIIKNINKGGRTFFLFDKEDKNITYEIDVYFGGKNFDNFRIAKPTIKTFPTGEVRQLFPNEARLKNLTYGADFFYGVDIDFTIKKGDNIILDHAPIQNAPFLQNIYLGKIPIMVQSDLCITKGASDELLNQMGEDRYEAGGYFIMDGQEKAIVSQERKAENIIFLNTVTDATAFDKYTHFAEIKSISDEAFTYSRTIKVQLEREGPITVRLGQERPLLKEQEGRDVPLVIMFRALGIQTDKEILQYIIGYDLENELSLKMLNLLRPSLLDPFVIREQIYDRESAEAYLAKLPSRAVAESKDKFSEILKNKVSLLSFLYQTLEESLFPHCGNDFTIKAHFLGYMTRRLLLLKLGLEKNTDRDSYVNKRVDISGFMLSNLFRDAFQQVIRKARVEINSTYTFNAKEYSGENIQYLINETNFTRIFSAETFKKHFNSELKKGRIGQKIGVVQALDRQTRNNTLAQLRRIIDRVPDGGRVPIPRRRLHLTQYGCVCPVETPEGPKVGLNKGLAMISHITFGTPATSITQFLLQNGTDSLTNLTPFEINGLCKVFVNGSWIGCHRDPAALCTKFRLYRRNGLINVFFSITWERNTNEIRVLTDNGRFVRPLYIIENNSLILQPRHISGIHSGDITFTDLVAGFRKRKERYNYYDGEVKPLTVLNLEEIDANLVAKLQDTQAAVEYIDTQEFDSLHLVRGFEVPAQTLLTYTHMELHPSMFLSFNAHLLPFMQHNQAARVILSNKVIKQGITTYAMNFRNRMDTSTHILNNPEKPLVMCRLHKALNIDKFGQGQNVFVAVASYNGYNQEDAIIANQSSVEMGLFNTSYFKTYYDTEKVDVKTGEENFFFNPRYSAEIPEYPEELQPKLRSNYDHLDKYGLIKEGTYLEDTSQVMIGKYMRNRDERGNDVYKDMSSYVKDGKEDSVVDKVFTWQSNKSGHRAVKIRTVQYRQPLIGDKFASRCAQKGTFGILIPKQDMPYTEDGVVPDLILTPGGLPSRMTVAQLLEILYGNMATELGLFGSYNPFDVVNAEQISDILENQLGLTSYGDRVLYNGVTGEQMDVKIFTGVIYYQRLKYMTNDKINTRIGGVREDGIPIPGGLYTVKERQSVDGRANGGGLKFGEMERDALVSHGVMTFLKESFIERCDKFVVWVSRKSGEITVGNPEDRIFYDIDDGPATYQLVSGTGGKGHDGKGYGHGVTTNNIIGLNLYGQKTRDFVRLEVPYTFKLLVQEMQGMFMKLRIDTEKLEDFIVEKGGDSDELQYSVDDLDALVEMGDMSVMNGANEDELEGSYELEGGADESDIGDEDDDPDTDEENQEETIDGSTEGDIPESVETTEQQSQEGGGSIEMRVVPQQMPLLQQHSPLYMQPVQQQQIPQIQQQMPTAPNSSQVISSYSVPLSGGGEEMDLSEYGGVKPDFNVVESNDNKIIENLNAQLLGIQLGGEKEEVEKTNSERVDEMLMQNREVQSQPMQTVQPMQQLQQQVQTFAGNGGGMDMSFGGNNLEVVEQESQYPQKAVGFDSDVKVVEIDTTKVKNGFLYGGASDKLDPFRPT